MPPQYAEQSLTVDHGHRRYTEGEDTLEAVEEEAGEVSEAVDGADNNIYPRDE